MRFWTCLNVQNQVRTCRIQQVRVLLAVLALASAFTAVPKRTAAATGSSRRCRQSLGGWRSVMAGCWTHSCRRKPRCSSCTASVDTGQNHMLQLNMRRNQRTSAVSVAAILNWEGHHLGDLVKSSGLWVILLTTKAQIVKNIISLLLLLTFRRTDHVKTLF